MPAVTQIPDHYPPIFRNNWEALTQQKMARLEQAVTVVEQTDGESQKFNQIGSLTMTKNTARAQKTNIVDLPLADRWLYPYPYDVGNIFDKWDERFLGKVILPKSPTVSAHAMAYNRALDDVIIEAAKGTAYSGKDGTTPNVFDTANQTVVHGSAQITLDKLIEARGIFGSNDVDEDDPITFFYNQNALNELLTEAKLTSSDYADVKALQTGKPVQFLNMTWVRSERLPKTGNIRSLYMVAKSGIALDPGSKQTMMDPRIDLSYALQIYSCAVMGAVRLEEKKVVEIQCDESA